MKMRKLLSRLLVYALALSMLALSALAISEPVFAESLEDKIEAIKAAAVEDKYHVIDVGPEGITEEIRKALADEDGIYLSEKPVGGITVRVVDSETNKPVPGATCLLTFMTKRSRVNTDGSEEQIANPFMLFNLGQTGADGTVALNQTYYYHTQKINPDAPFSADSMQVGVANIVDEDPLVKFDYGITPYIANNAPEIFNAFTAGLGQRPEVHFSEVKKLLTEASGDRYTEAVRNIFDDEFAVFSDSVKIKVYDGKENEPLIAEGKQTLTIGEFKAYIDSHRDLYTQYVALKHYDDLAGFTPAFTLTYEPPYDTVITYKDGSTKAKTNKAYLGLRIFDNPTGGTGYAISKSFFSYRAYILAEGYKEGRSIGASIRQDFINKEVVATVYISKSMAPVTVNSGNNAVYGQLKDDKGAPVAQATIHILDTEMNAVTNAEGEFSFTAIKNEPIKLEIISPENGNLIEGYAVYQGKEYALDAIPITWESDNQALQITLVTGKATGTSGLSKDLGSEKGLGTIVIVVAAVLILILILVLVLFLGKKRKQRCPKCNAELPKDASTCSQCGHSLSQPK